MTHRTPTTFWSSASYDQLVEEIVGMKQKLEAFGIRDVVGFRSPFLQTAGDTTFSVLKDHGFLYDSSLPARLGNVWWPYTFEYGTGPQNCVIDPCPTRKLYYPTQDYRHSTVEYLVIGKVLNVTTLIERI